MAMIRLCGLRKAGNVCLTLICDTDTGDALQGPLDPAAAATLKAPDGEGVIRIPAERRSPGCSTASARTLVLAFRLGGARVTLLTADQLGEVLEQTHRDLFRIETLPDYKRP